MRPFPLIGVTRLRSTGSNGAKKAAGALGTEKPYNIYDIDNTRDLRNLFHD